jgi:hypothetical protein
LYGRPGSKRRRKNSAATMTIAARERKALSA